MPYISGGQKFSLFHDKGKNFFNLYLHIPGPEPLPPTTEVTSPPVEQVCHDLTVRNEPRPPEFATQPYHNSTKADGF
jgi:hypothetical protein